MKPLKNLPVPGLVRWGILGCGNVTELKSGPAFAKVAGSALVAVMRRDAAKAADYARRHQVARWYSDADALIADADVDAVYIATPPASHKELALKVAAAGKLCCVEKPMALNAAECAEMVQAFEKRGLPLYVAYYRRSLPRFLQLKAWLEQGRIGEVRQVHWNFSRMASAQDLSGQAHWRVDPAVAGGGYFVDLASHGLDLLMYLLGDIAEVKGFTARQQGLYQAEDAVTAIWRFQSGVLGSGYWNFVSAARQDHLSFIGSQGRIDCAVFDDLPLKLTTAEGTQELHMAHPEHIQQPHIATMVQDILQGSGHPSTGATALRTNWVMDRILAQA
ncbi:Gfo/Idh/MocA family oxidoreductase [Rheinheimera sp.]|uniref:Gfo/Idh/MocA family protein n=1 Tax=Rheinheimera sp. TaxID=1869214 RepID=UPI00307EA4F3